MVYMGSKSKISKDLKIIIENFITKETEAYIEPFVGGANMIDKIDFDNKIGYDTHKELIALLNYVKDEKNLLPLTFSEDEYNKVKNNRSDFEDWYVGLVGFCGAYGANYFTGFARSMKSHGDGYRDMPRERILNIEKQRSKLKDITFINDNYVNIDTKNSVIYCDPPYKDKGKYQSLIDYDEFYQWCVDMTKKNNIVLVSEYNIKHKNFKEVWSKEIKVQLKNDVDKKPCNQVEKLYKVEL